MSKKLSDNQIKQTFGETVREIRLSQNKSQEDIALDANMDLTSINEIEQGHRNPMLISIYKIAGALKVEPSILLKDL